MRDLGVALHRSGQRVGVLTTTPGRRPVWRRLDGVATWYLPAGMVPAHRRWDFAPEAAFAPLAALGTLAARPDLVHAFHFADAYGAGQAGRVRRRPLVLKLTGTVLPERVAARPAEERMLRSALRSADEVWCNSGYAASAMAGFGVVMRVVPAGVDEAVFFPRVPRAAEPIVLVAGAVDDPRKRVVDLLRAWPAILAGAPGARLRLAGAAGPVTLPRLLAGLPAAAAARVDVLGDLGSAALAEEYAAAWVLVAPAVHEALGLTVLEALACGTPVAAADSGAFPDLLASGNVGVLFGALDPGECARGVLAALALAEDARCVERARAAAGPYFWSRLLPEILERYRSLAG